MEEGEVEIPEDDDTSDNTQQKKEENEVHTRWAGKQKREKNHDKFRSSSKNNCATKQQWNCQNNWNLAKELFESFTFVENSFVTRCNLAP